MELTAEAPATDSIESRGMARRALVAAWHNIGFLVYVLVLGYCVVGAFDPPRLNWGDSGSDYNVMASGRNFQRYGFIHLRLTPNLLDRSVWVKGDTVHIYTHYPQLPELANGMYRIAFGMSDIVQFRLVALVFSFAAFFFIYRLIFIFWSRQAAQVAIALWVSNPLWVQHADYLHNGPYAMFFGYGCVYFLVRSLHADSRKWLLLSGAFLFLTYCSSYDYWIYTPLLLAVATAAHFGGLFRRDVSRVLATLAVFAAAAIAGKVATAIWALGGVPRFIQDLRLQGVEHTTGDVIVASYESGLWTTLVGRVERYFSLLLIPLALFWSAMPWIRRRWSDRLPGLPLSRPNPIFLLLAAIPFLCIFRELWVGQYYPFLMIVPFYAVGFATVITALVESRQRSAQAIGAAILLALSYSTLDEHVRFKKAFFDRPAIQMLQSQLATAPRGQRVYVNHVFDAVYRYYFDRNVFTLIPHESYRVDAVMDYYSDPLRSPYPHPEGMLFVRHKHLADEVFDKGYYAINILGHYRLWDAWANPPAYRRFLDSLLTDRDSLLMMHVARRSTKVYESDFYSLWRLNPVKPGGAPLDTSRRDTSGAGR